MKLYGYVLPVGPDGRTVLPAVGDTLEVLVFEAGPVIPRRTPVEFTERFAVALPNRAVEQP